MFIHEWTRTRYLLYGVHGMSANISTRTEGGYYYTVRAENAVVYFLSLAIIVNSDVEGR